MRRLDLPIDQRIEVRLALSSIARQHPAEAKEHATNLIHLLQMAEILSVVDDPSDVDQPPSWCRIDSRVRSSPWPTP